MLGKKITEGQQKTERPYIHKATHPVPRKLARVVVSGSMSVAIMLSGCSQIMNTHIAYDTIEPQQYPILTSVGYASISAQNGADRETKMLNAMTASKILAYQELAEQVHGVQVNSQATVEDLLVNNQRLSMSVQGLIKGAKVIKSYPVGEDSYVTELSLDMQRIRDLDIAVSKPKKIGKITYY